MGPHTITAIYSANGIFAASTSSAITQTITAPAVQFAFSPTSLTIPRGSSASTTITFTSVGGVSGTIVPSCGTLPAHLSCTFAPASVTLTAGSAQTVTLTIGTTAMSALDLRARPGARSLNNFYAVLLLPFCCLGMKFRKGSQTLQRSRLLFTLLATISLTGLTLGLSGCGSSGNKNTAAPGTYSVPVNYTLNGTANLAAHPLQVIVQ